MPKLSGIFSQFNNLHQLKAEEISFSLKNKLDLHLVENFIGNKVLYPQTIPTTKQDLEIEFLVLQEALKNEPSTIYDPNQRKLILNQEFFSRFMPTEKLIATLIDGLGIKDVVKIYFQVGTTVSLVGSIVPLQSFLKQGEFNVLINNQKVNLPLGDIKILAYTDHHNRFKLNNQNEIVIPGGNLGLALDLRK